MTDALTDAVRAALEYDPLTGLFRRLGYQPYAKQGWYAGSPSSTGHLQLRVAGKAFKAHRLAWLLCYGEWPRADIDHINGIPPDNRILNLREASHHQNMAHRWSTKRAEKPKSVRCEPTGRWRSSIGFQRRTINLGTFSTRDEAAHAYNKAAIRLHGDFAVLNPVGVCPRSILAAKLGGSNE